MKKLRLLLIAIYICILAPVCAQQHHDSIQVSLLTCTPSQEIYGLFGHTAIRYRNFTQQQDWVFNYGMFNFNTPHFVYRFVKGETDYQLGIMPYKYFEAEYAMGGRSVYQQVLNLTQAEKEKLILLLEENYRPENRIYRYNYFYDNCTTRARDQIERCISGKVVYPSFAGLSGKSFRDIVHEFTSESPWDELGIDLCLGEEADRPITIRQQMFEPFYMRKYAQGATIVASDGSRRPLVESETKIVDVTPEEPEKGFPLSPLMCGALFLALNVLIGWLQWKRKRIYWGWDIVLYGMQGVAGCIIAFLFFFSTHPTVGSNWLLWLLNPIPLFYLPFMVYHTVKHRKEYYFRVNMVCLTLFIAIFPLLPQEFNLTVLPLALGLLVNSASHLLVENKKE